MKLPLENCSNFVILDNYFFISTGIETFTMMKNKSIITNKSFCDVSVWIGRVLIFPENDQQVQTDSATIYWPKWESSINITVYIVYERLKPGANESQKTRNKKQETKRFSTFAVYRLRHSETKKNCLIRESRFSG